MIASTVAILFLVALGCVSNANDDVISIKPRIQVFGDIVRITETGEESKTSKGRVDNKPFEERKQNSWTVVFGEEVLSDGQKLTLKRTHSKAEMTTNSKMHSIDILNMPIIAAKNDNNFDFSYTINSEPVDDNIKSFLDRIDAGSIGRSGDLWPKNPVKIGEPWQIDPLAILNSAEMAPDPTKSSAIGTLLKTYNKKGSTYGVIEFKIKLACTTLRLKPLGNTIPLKPGSEIQYDITMDLCIDGSDPSCLQTGTATSRFELDSDEFECVFISNTKLKRTTDSVIK